MEVQLLNAFVIQIVPVIAIAQDILEIIFQTGIHIKVGIVMSSLYQPEVIHHVHGGKHRNMLESVLVMLITL